MTTNHDTIAWTLLNPHWLTGDYWKYILEIWADAFYNHNVSAEIADKSYKIWFLEVGKNKKFTNNYFIVVIMVSTVIMVII